jgi:hypothetical protein
MGICIANMVQLIGERGRRSGESVKRGLNVNVAHGEGAFLLLNLIRVG